MAVTASLRDRDGQILDAKIASITAYMSTYAAGSSVRNAMNSQLDAAQIDAVNHYLKYGRINAATILSTLS